MLTGKALLAQANAKNKDHQKVFKTLKTMAPHDVDALFHAAHEEVFSYTDCLQCANCCKTTPALLTDRDIMKIAKHLRITVQEFHRQYVRRDEDGDHVFKHTPCVFLERDNTCRIYAFRPQACREYPHTDARKMKQILDITYKNREICPAVMDIVEILKDSLD